MTDGLEAAQQAEAEAGTNLDFAVKDWLARPWDSVYEMRYRRARGLFIAAVRATEKERAGESALRAAAQEVVESQESVYGPCEPGCKCSIALLKTALDDAPWEPSEEQVERAAEAAAKADPVWSHENAAWQNLVSEGDAERYRAMARAALKAAMGSATST